MNLAYGLYALVLAAAVIGVLAARQRDVAGPLVVGFFLRATFVVLDNLYLGISLGGDGRSWDVWAKLWASRSLPEILSIVDTGHVLFKVYMALMYHIVGHSSLMIQVVNALLGTVVVLYVWKLARLLGAGERPARRGAWIVALFPSTILHSGMLLREVAVTLPLTIGVYHLASWHRARRPADAVFAGGALLISMAFHSGAFAVILALTVWIAGSWVRALAARKSRLFLRNTAALLLAGGAVAFAAGTGWGMEKFRRIETGDLGTLSQEQDYATKGRTAYLQDLRADSFPELLLQSPVRVAYFLFAPFPWMISSLRDAIGFADALLFLWLGWRLVRGKRILQHNSTALMVVALFAAMALTFALGVSNYGTAFRHRSKMLPMLVAVAAAVPRRHPSRTAVFPPVHAQSPGSPASALHSGAGQTMR